MDVLLSSQWHDQKISISIFFYPSGSGPLVRILNSKFKFFWILRKIYFQISFWMMKNRFEIRKRFQKTRLKWNYATYTKTEIFILNNQLNRLICAVSGNELLSDQNAMQLEKSISLFIQ